MKLTEVERLVEWTTLPYRSAERGLYSRETRERDTNEIREEKSGNEFEKLDKEEGSGDRNHVSLGSVNCHSRVGILPCETG